MKKQVVFMHQTYPAQFGPVSEFLLKNFDVDVSFFAQYVNKPVHPGVRFIQYNPAPTKHEDNPYFFARYFEQEAASMHGIYNTLQTSKINPDVLVGHVAFGNMGLLHVDYKHVPRIGFFELFYDPFGNHSENRVEYPAPKPNRIRIPLRNATQLVELEYCTKGYSPTAFQKSTYPSVYQDKLSVIFDGIDTDFWCPGEVAANSELVRTWPADAKIVTYVSRGLEAMRGFDIFMEVAHQICQRRHDVHFVIAGNPKTNYGSEMIAIKEPSFKEFVLKRQPYDLNRFHFVEWLSEPALRDLYRLSDCHFYWTVPFTLSWSLLQSMATGCIVTASNSAPVRDAITNGVNGILFESRDREAATEAILSVLDHADSHSRLRKQARADMVERFSFDACLPKLAEFFLAANENSAATNSRSLGSIAR